MLSRFRPLYALTLLAVVLVAQSSPSARGDEPELALGELGWVWPTDERRVLRAFEAPAHEYGPGHRGIDVPSPGFVRAPADGVVAFSGPVAGRGIVTIDHGNGLVTSFEPVVSELTPGTVVAPGEVVADLEAGGHVGPGTLHFGVRLDGEYVNPLLLLGGIPRAVLLRCC